MRFGMHGPAEPDALGRARDALAGVELCVVDRPRVSVGGQTAEIPEGCQATLVFLALHDALQGDHAVGASARVPRRVLARALWPTADPERAAGNLRSALWRLRCAGIHAVDTSEGCVFLASDIDLDLHRVVDLSKHVLGQCPDTIVQDLKRSRIDPRHVDVRLATAALDMLPGWYAEWAIEGRARVRSLVLDTFDALCCEWCRQGRFADAIDLALVAVNSDPFRESSRRALISAHLEEHNIVEARRAFDEYRRMLDAELGVKLDGDGLSFAKRA